MPLHEAVETGAFRADLFHRLNGVIVDLPPLREREDDIEILARHFVAAFGARLGKADLDVAADALDALRRYPWPGNVRELQRVLSAAVVLSNDAVVADDLPAHIRSTGRSIVAAPPLLESPLGDPPPMPSDLSMLNLREIKEWAGREAQKRVIQELAETHQHHAPGTRAHARRGSENASLTAARTFADAGRRARTRTKD